MKRFCIVTAGWNCCEFVKGCLESIKAQTNQDFQVVIVDDGSNDGTSEQIKKYAEPHWIIVTNPENKGGYYSYTNGAKVFEDCEIMMWVGLDDKMKPNALQEIDKQYRAGKLLTYGTYINLEGFVYKDLHYSDACKKNRDYRKEKFRATAIRSFWYEMYKAIPVYEQTEIEKNIYYDVEIAFSLLEMAGADRIGVIDIPIYEYNNRNPNSTHTRHGRNWDEYNKICNRPKRELWGL
jgi:glycosyltransferase involved in cell wall biosynthesis